MYTQKFNGFSLIELMVAIAIVGILASIAIPTYSNYLKRAKITNMITYIQQGQTIVADYIANTGDTTCTNLAMPAVPATLDQYFYGGGGCSVQAGGLTSDFGFSPEIGFYPTMNNGPSGITITWLCTYFAYNVPSDGVDYNAILQSIVPKECVPD